MSTYKVSSSMSMPERCSLNGKKTLRSADSFRLFSGVTGRVMKDDSEVDPAFADDFLGKGGQPIIGGYLVLTCRSCHSCLPVRVALSDFTPDGEHRRILRKNADLAFTAHDGLPDLVFEGTDEHTSLHRRYMIDRFHGGVAERFDTMDAAFNLRAHTHFPGMRPFHINARDETGALQGAIWFHAAKDAAYGTLFFHEPARRATSLGQAMMLHGIAHLQSLGKNYLYLAHWTRHASDYSWKDNYTPLDVMVDGAWKRFNDKAAMRTLRTGGGPAYPARKPNGPA